MDDPRILKQLLFGELSQDKKNQGRPQKCFQVYIKTSITFAGLHPKQLEIYAESDIGFGMLVCPYEESPCQL